METKSEIGVISISNKACNGEHRKWEALTQQEILNMRVS